MSDHDLLIRIDERVTGTQTDVKDIHQRLKDGDKRLDKGEANIKVLQDRWKWVKWAVPGGLLAAIAALIKSLFE